MGKKNRAKKGSRVAKETTKAANKNNKSFSNSHDKKRKFGLYEIYKNATQSVKVRFMHGANTDIPTDILISTDIFTDTDINTDTPNFFDSPFIIT